MTRQSEKILQTLLFTLGLLLVLQTPDASAHRGGEPRLVDVEAGDFRLSVWTLPVPLETGEANFIAFVAESTTNESENSFVRANTPVLDAEIEMILKPIDGGDPIVLKPDHEEATNKLFYETYFELIDEGGYEGVIRVESGDRSGTADFSFDAARGTVEINWFRYSGIAVLIVAVGWFIFQLRQDDKEEEVA
ncbi:MAG: hypothetical protein AAF902_10125 [Chloroflexota bacterium]